MFTKLQIRVYVKEKTEIFEIIDIENKNLIKRFIYPLGTSIVNLYYSDKEPFFSLMGETNPLLKKIRNSGFHKSKLYNRTYEEGLHEQEMHKENLDLDAELKRLAEIAAELPNHHIYYYVYQKYIFDLLNLIEEEKGWVTNYKHLSHIRFDALEYKALLEFLFDKCFDVNLSNKIPFSEKFNQINSKKDRNILESKYVDFELSLPKSIYTFNPEKKYSADEFARKSNEISQIIFAESLSDIVNYLILQIISNDVKFNICKNCGRYFAITGHKNVEYCDRPVNNSNRTCKDVGAAATYRNKKNDEPIFKAYNKAYKTRNARIKYGKITRDEFKIWSKHARQMRDKAYAGEITYEQLVSWLNSDF